MNSSKNINSAAILSLILMASLIWLGSLHRHTWIFPASASDNPSSESITLLPDFMILSSPEAREVLIRLAKNSLEYQSLAMGLMAQGEEIKNADQNVNVDLERQSIVEFGPAIDDGSKAILYIRTCPPSASRISVHLEFVATKSGWKISGVSYGRKYDEQHLDLVSSH